MKKINLIILIVLISFMIDIPNAFALKTGITNVNESFAIDKDEVYFDELDFDAYQTGKEHQIGFMGEVRNNSDEDKTLYINIKYYNRDKKRIATDNKELEIPKKSTLFYNLHSGEKDLDCNVQEIKYYDFSFDDKKNNAIINSDSINKYIIYGLGIVIIIIILYLIYRYKDKLLNLMKKKETSTYEDIIEDINEANEIETLDDTIIDSNDNIDDITDNNEETIDNQDIIEDIELLDDEEPQDNTDYFEDNIDEDTTNKIEDEQDISSFEDELREDITNKDEDDYNTDSCDDEVDEDTTNRVEDDYGTDSSNDELDQDTTNKVEDKHDIDSSENTVDNENNEDDDFIELL